MDHPYYSLPFLTELEMFEAFGRHRSLELAASEFNVAPDVVRRRIKAIEEELGVSLVARFGAGVTLTGPGEDLCRALSEIFRRASDVFGTLRR
ncbi:hypothetical protein CK215_28605 [Mesorhizobium sp. WSM3864]|uniref:LysR family transcriptional regulator n=1 Tax=unclassified Mesorhizobium TaxID=325217 RepID=UPI000BAFF54C|nr:MULTISPECIES: LysR family transcriptional regulator [unclassified Mesorhizobium]TGV89890.1 LysR family transcriptional regulator [Mesorhizobium sp. M00.F.Ca.ET.158.01.1.1]PBB89223.1 hypothetical protein CK215_28605 [Mesorhizobium sp. WSM3864]RWE25126.1 MAG: LysR family transcriptional regulator [Mesorhizobium sp.]TGQ18998.1 LysR family transcriptional regulator [Mesorhizobium sp. M00.F.Ca.ET.217.01.1.1]TIU88158.1 MAG: LysR family transcriptional regulator [Mesorhizobium sp.]